MTSELTVDYVLRTKFKTLYFAPLGREVSHAIAVQGVIQIDPRSRSPLGRLLLHELIHVRRPVWSETKVIQWERRLWKEATWQQKAAFFKLLGRGLMLPDSDVADEEENDEPAGPTAEGA